MWLPIRSRTPYRKLILIASESSSPLTVRGVGISLSKCLCEGYPDEETRDEPGAVLDYNERLAHFRRYSDLVIIKA
jgi:hypothetical protein